MSLSRIFRHVFAEGSARRHFHADVLDAIQQAIAAGEQRHTGQVCFAVEGALSFTALWRGCTPAARAQQVFANLRVWDTEHNTGVLIFVLLADHAIEIVADRGVATGVGADQWKSICDRMRDKFSAGEYRDGAIAGIEAVNDLLAKKFPAGNAAAPNNELPDRPRVLR